jgi:uridine monophosphate synthetase
MGDFARAHGLHFDCVVGLPHAGDPFAKAFPPGHPFSDQFFPKLRLHKEEGEKRRIVGPPEGDYQPGQTVLVVDDLITKANTKLEGIAVLETAGLRVRDVLVIVDRQQGGTQELRERGYRLHSLLPLVDLLETLARYKKILPELQSEILRYIGN